MGTGDLGSWGGCVHTAVLKTDHQQGPDVEHRELCSLLCGSLDGRGARGRMDSCMWMAVSLRCPPETITTLLVGYTPIQIFLKKNGVESINNN